MNLSDIVAKQVMALADKATFEECGGRWPPPPHRQLAYGVADD